MASVEQPNSLVAAVEATTSAALIDVRETHTTRRQSLLMVQRSKTRFLAFVLTLKVVAKAKAKAVYSSPKAQLSVPEERKGPSLVKGFDPWTDSNPSRSPEPTTK